MDITPCITPEWEGRAANWVPVPELRLSLSERAAGDVDVGQVVLRSTIAFLHGNDKISKRGTDTVGSNGSDAEET